MTVPHHYAANLSDPAASINQNGSRGHAVLAENTLLRKLDNLTVLGDDNVLGRHTHHPPEFCMLDQHPVLAMYRNKIFWLHQSQDHFLFFLTRMSGNVQIGVSVVDHLRTFVKEFINHAADGVLIAGNGRS